LFFGFIDAKFAIVINLCYFITGVQSEAQAEFEKGIADSAGSNPALTTRRFQKPNPVR
jgi:hypothetical protein